MSVYFGDVTFDAARRQLRRGGEPVHVSPKAFQLLAMLIAENPRAVSKEEIQDRLWPDVVVSEGNLFSLIAELRSSLGDDAKKPRYIRTVHGFGYSFAGNIGEEVADEAPAIAALPQSASEVPVEIRIRWGVLVAALVLVLGAAAWLVTRSRPQPNSHAPHAIRSLAVLPFDTHGVNETDAHLGLGLADVIITRLSNVDALTVRPTSAIRNFTGQNFDSREAGRKLHVDGVLEGSIRTDGQRVRVTVQLIDMNKEKPIWAEEFDETKAEMFTIEDQISSRVADAITVRLTPAERNLLAKRYTVSPEAYQLYVLGRYNLQKGAAAQESALSASKFFAAAVEKDPNYALAWAGLATGLTWVAVVNMESPPEYFIKAEEATLRARQIDPQLYEVLYPLQLLRMYWHLDYAGAEREFQRALALRPRDADMLAAYGYLLQCLGRVDDAVAIRRRLFEIEPLSLRSHWTLANGLLTARQYALAKAKVQDVLAMDPHHYEANIGLIRIFLAERKYDDAIRVARKLVATGSSSRRAQAFLGYTLAVAGHKDEAREILQELERESASKYMSPFNLVIIHIALGENDAAITLLEKAIDDRSYAIRVKTEPLLDPLRQDPRFPALLRRAGFVS
jgi:TolB-like protein/DNA-binding winged helix-turn-helix (wHTH) protein/Tfp pilus assembly protein PilF